jgi:hypothetical protein
VCVCKVFNLRRSRWLWCFVGTLCGFCARWIDGCGGQEGIIWGVGDAAWGADVETAVFSLEMVGSADGCTWWSGEFGFGFGLFVNDA